MQQLSRAHRLRHARPGYDRDQVVAPRRRRKPELSDQSLGVAEACATILKEVAPLEGELVALRDGLGRVLAEEVRSPLALPPWDNASMDGYAVRAADVADASAATPATLRVIGTSAAGAPTGGYVGAGEAMRIMTGAPVPNGADSVIRVEDTDAGAATVHIRQSRDALRNIRPRGEDIRKGDVAVSSGTELFPGHLGLLASVGRGEVLVHRRPRVAVLASGDELVDVDRFDEVLSGDGTSGKIVSSNSYSLEAAIRQAGADAVPLGFVGDDPVAMRERLTDCECDLLITTGGISVGEFDYTRSVLAELGATHRFWRVRMRPGAPVGFGLLRGTPWLGLPGNPVSTLVTFELFGRPAIRKMLGHSLVFRRTVRVRLGESVTIAAPLTHFLRAELVPQNDQLVAKLTGPQGSGLMSSMARANALLILPPERSRVEAGEVVDALLLRDDFHHADTPPAT